MHGLVGKAYQNLQGLGFSGFDKKDLQSITLSANLPPQLTVVKQSQLFDDNMTMLLTVQEKEIVFATNAYAGFDKFAERLSRLVTVFSEAKFPPIKSTTLRYLNEFLF